jgi:NADPH:quinone reductase
MTTWNRDAARSTAFGEDPMEKAVRAVTVSDYGAPPVLMELPIPSTGPGQILIKLAAAGMNPMDASLASGEWRPAPATFPMVLGVDGAGTVDALGQEVTRYSLGQRIFGQLLLAPIGSTGTYAEYVAVSGEAPLASVPKGLDLIAAAAVPTVGGTGLTLVESLEPLEDKTVLLVGAGGGVGSFAAQYAVIGGARVIANVRAPAEKRVRAYGVAETICHPTVPLAETIRRAHPDGIDVLVDLASDAESFAWLASLVRRGAPRSAPGTSRTPEHSRRRGSAVRTLSCARRARSWRESQTISSIAGSSRRP